MSRFYFGVAGWSYPDWEGIVYPKALRKSDQLPFISSFFDTIELNNTFYRIPESKMVENWVRKVEPYPDFRFTAKLWQGFTHELKTDLKADLNLESDQFKNAMKPMLESGKFGALLIQFPISFRRDDANVQRVIDLGERFREFHPVVEFRHRSWVSAQVLQLLEENGLGFCNVDEPVFRQMVKPSSVVTGSVGYVRFHGRNYENWFSKEGNRDTRYDYLYSEDELDEWIPRIRQMGEKAGSVYVVGNNHFRGQAPANILQLKSKTIGEPLRMPEDLLEAFPQLKKASRTPGRPQQKKLF